MEIAAVVLVILIAVVLVVYPLLNKPRAISFGSDGAIREEVDRYRAAIKSKTLCDFCLTANPAKSNYCSGCGRGL
jgi:hypothetical protein